VNRLARIILLLGVALMAVGAQAAETRAAAEAEASGESGIMALGEVEPGMKGEWRTVVRGTDIERFELEVLGVVTNFIGPKRSVILCRALTPSQVTSGPVGGMSGSPVYIDDKLVGAYAYGYLWPKEQAIIGVTPIEQMLEVLAFEPEKPLGEFPWGGGLADGRAGPRRDGMAAAGGNWRVTAGSAELDAYDIGQLLTPLPTPLMASGISGRVLDAFSEEFAKRGLRVVNAPLGTAASSAKLGADDLQPGSAVAGVLMSGDFKVAGTGTVTWRDGERVLAFGHPFMQSGAVAMPMAAAEIVTVIQSLPRSFKLANVGPTVGAIYQDRLTAIAGEIGRRAPVTDVSIAVTDEKGERETYGGELFMNRELSPVLSAVSLLQALTSTMESSERQTFSLRSTIRLEGYEPIITEDVATGPTGALDLAFGHLAAHDVLMDNPFAIPYVEEVRFEVDVREDWRRSTLRRLDIASGRVRPGETFTAIASLRNYLDEPEYHRIEVPIPDEVPPGSELKVFVGDAEAASEIERGARRGDLDELADIVSYLRQARSSDKVYVKLLLKGEGLRLGGETLTALPPSVRAVLASERSRQLTGSAPYTTLWETQIPVDGVFTGSQLLDVALRR